MELNEILKNFLQDLTFFNPSLVLIHIPHLFDERRTVDITKIFPRQAVIVKCMESLFGHSDNLNRTELQPLMFSSKLR